MTGDSRSGSAGDHFSDVGRSTIAEWLKAAREAAGKTQRQAGNFLDVDSQTVSNWETGRHPIGAEELLRLAGFYGADLALLMVKKKAPAAERPKYVAHKGPRPSEQETETRRKGRAG